MAVVFLRLLRWAIQSFFDLVIFSPRLYELWSFPNCIVLLNHVMSCDAWSHTTIERCGLLEQGTA